MDAMDVIDAITETAAHLTAGALGGISATAHIAAEDRANYSYKASREILGGEEIIEGGITMNEVKDIWGLPSGEIRPTRKRWPKNCSPVVVEIVFEGLVFTVAKAQIAIGVNGKPKSYYVAEGISRLSPEDEEKRDPMVGKERAIQQAIRALHVRVMKHRRSYHHYRG